MSKLQAVYYRDPAGREPVREYVRALDARRRAVLRHQLDRLNELSPSVPHLPFPHRSQIHGQRTVSPIGTAVADDLAEDLRDPELRAEY